MSNQNNTPPPFNLELKFIMKIMNFMMGNMCGRLEKVGKYGNAAGTCTQDVRKVGAEAKLNNGSEAERPRWVDYEEDGDDIGDGGFKDETIGHWEGFWQPRNRRDFMLTTAVNAQQASEREEKKCCNYDIRNRTAATFIQSCWRRLLVRKELQRL
jgi:hypothetical protein